MYYLFVLSSVTYAMKAKEILFEYGISASIEKVKRQYTQRGCSYGVIVKANDVESARQLLSNSGITVFNIFAYEDSMR